MVLIYLFKLNDNNCSKNKIKLNLSGTFYLIQNISLRLLFKLYVYFLQLFHKGIVILKKV